MIGTHWIAFYVNCDNVTCFDLLELSTFQEKFKEIIGNKSMTTNIYRVQAYVSVMFGHYFTGFIDFTQKLKVS